MAESCIQEQFACTVCGANLVRIDVTAPIPYDRLAAFYAALTATLRAESVCDGCRAAAQPESTECG